MNFRLKKSKYLIEYFVFYKNKINTFLFICIESRCAARFISLCLKRSCNVWICCWNACSITSTGGGGIGGIGSGGGGPDGNKCDGGGC